MTTRGSLPNIEEGRALSLADQEIIDWYDGIVQALVRFPDQETWHYQCLIAWDPESPQRVYAVVGLDPQQEETLLAAIRRGQGDGEEALPWDEIQLKVQGALSEPEEESLLLLCDGPSEVVRRLARTDTQSIRPYLGHDVESLLELSHTGELIEKLTRAGDS